MNYQTNVDEGFGPIDCSSALPPEIVNVWTQLNEKQKEDFLRSMRKLAIESQRKRKIVETVAMKQGMSPIAFRKALETALENKAELWSDFRNASRFDLLRAEEHHKQRLELAKSLRGAKKKLANINQEIKQRFKLASLQVELHSMPEIPTPELTREQWAMQTEKFAGVYIAFERGAVQYVGESCNVPQRMRSHETVREDWLVSVIKTAPADRFFAECYYIWLLRPPRNKEGTRTMREVG